MALSYEEAKKIILTGESSIESLTKQINNGRLDNKNRLQYYARFNNTEANANCVYRVYTYIKYVNESNELGGSTIGPISSTHLDIDAIDLGVPMLAMHSARELCGVHDMFYLKELAKEFFNKN